MKKTVTDKQSGDNRLARYSICRRSPKTNSSSVSGKWGEADLPSCAVRSMKLVKMEPTILIKDLCKGQNWRMCVISHARTYFALIIVSL